MARLDDPPTSFPNRLIFLPAFFRGAASRLPASRAIALPAEAALDRTAAPTFAAFRRTLGSAAAFRTALSTTALVATAATAFASRLARPAMDALR